MFPGGIVLCESLH